MSISDWFRKKSAKPDWMVRTDAEIAKAQEYYTRRHAELMRELEPKFAEIQSAQLSREAKQVEAIASAPLNSIQWTPVLNGYGQIIAIAWKNDPVTASLLLEQPGEGWA